MEIRDPIHGLIEYNEIEENIINSPPFQRLRGIRQLALATFVYPGAHHTRFEHCIGTMHLAGKVGEKLELDGDKRNFLRLAGLLHDIGHGPFSHVSEQIMEKYAKKFSDEYRDVAENTHELMSILLIQKQHDIKKILNQEQRDNIVEFLKKQKRRSIEKDIISGPLDVDKLDYLLRDSHFAGVRYGVFDLDKITESLIPIPISKRETQLGIDEEGIHAVEQMLLAKYHMNAQVYQHRIRRVTDAMLVRGIEYALQDRVSEIERLYIFEDTDKFLQNYLNYNDYLLIDAILHNGKGHSLEYFQRLIERRLLKEVFSININSINFPDTPLLENIKLMSEPQMKEIANQAAQLFSTREYKIDPSLVIIDKQTVSNPTFKSPQVRIDTDTIMVKTREEERKTFPEISAVFSNRGIDPENETLYIYLPLDSIEKREDRRNFIENRRDKLTEIIKGVFK